MELTKQATSLCDLLIRKIHDATLISVIFNLKLPEIFRPTELIFARYRELNNIIRDMLKMGANNLLNQISAITNLYIPRHYCQHLSAISFIKKYYLQINFHQKVFLYSSQTLQLATCLLNVFIQKKGRIFNDNPNIYITISLFLHPIFHYRLTSRQLPSTVFNLA